MTRAPTDRSHLSIGEVLSLLQDEFPDVTISKIRFLEAQGLLDPERTPSGYRKFYDADVDRLRYILREQKENYLPLRVIKDRLDETGPVRTAPTAAGPTGHDDDRPVGRQNGVTAVALDDRPSPADPPAVRTDEAVPSTAPAANPPAARAAPRPQPASPPARAPAHDPGHRDPSRRDAGRTDAGRRDVGRPDAGGRDAGRTDAGRPDVADVIEAPSRRRPATDDPTLQLGRTAEARPAPPAAGDGSVSLTADELAQASGLSPRAVRELEGYGLLESHVVGDTTYYDADALVIARTAAGFLEHGIEARHIRSYKVAVEREAGLYEQIVLPLLKQRNPDARRRASQTVTELVRLGDEMRSVLLRRGLRDHIPPA